MTIPVGDMLPMKSEGARIQQVDTSLLIRAVAVELNSTMVRTRTTRIELLQASK